MQYIKLDENIWIRYDSVNRKVIATYNVSDCQAELLAIEDRLSNIPAKPTDEEYLEWGKANMPVMNYDNEVNSLTSRKSEIEAFLANI